MAQPSPRSASGRKREGWTQDLQDAIRQATSAKLIESLVTQESHKATQGTTQAVQAAAEVNKQVILGHRQQAANSRAAMETALAKVLSLADNVADIREADAQTAIDAPICRGAHSVPAHHHEPAWR